MCSIYISNQIKFPVSFHVIAHNFFIDWNSFIEFYWVLRTPTSGLDFIWISALEIWKHVCVEYLFHLTKKCHYSHCHSSRFWLFFQVSFAQYSNVVIFGVPQMVSSSANVSTSNVNTGSFNSILFCLVSYSTQLYNRLLLWKQINLDHSGCNDKQSLLL